MDQAETALEDQKQAAVTRLTV